MLNLNFYFAFEFRIWIHVLQLFAIYCYCVCAIHRFDSLFKSFCCCCCCYCYFMDTNPLLKITFAVWPDISESANIKIFFSQGNAISFF